ncbi:MAG: hypothetical protein ISS67_05980 [Desulfobacterales bacterium]|uniref:Uncharacterized protein n=1 Tax=Candidatus Desulfatibia profunda TaxID=2841695 RepID=A0A8J6THY0_9BACT|nr:hypothetical protein [Candidatus Desulfatibia profunda]MBL7180277.1 hypothetical protein [Desulfobacterales bacterium]MBL7208054.1 hypothetical protein [Desulfobacterales bacterium]
MQIELTIKDILNDIEEFQERISAAQSKLNMLPAGYLPYPEYKKREKQRRDLQAKIEHVEKLIRIATEGLKEI